MENDVQDAHQEYLRTGCGLALLEAIRRCGQYGVPIPRLIYDDYVAVLEKYKSGEARTLDDAFSVSRPESWNQTGARNMSRKVGYGVISVAGSVYQEVMRRPAGVAIDMELFEDIVNKLNLSISASTARKYWQELNKTKQGQ